MPRLARAHAREREADAFFVSWGAWITQPGQQAWLGRRVSNPTERIEDGVACDAVGVEEERGQWWNEPGVVFPFDPFEQSTARVPSRRGDQRHERVVAFW